VGEISAFLKENHFYTLEADVPSVIFELTLENLKAMEQDHPIFAIAVYKAMVTGLAQTAKLLSTAKV
jgi:CRP-like cAMP-binding protein